MMMFFLFLVGGVGWGVIRSQVTMTEVQRRIFWAAAVVLFALPGFLGFQNNPAITEVIWPFLAGLMVGELAWNRYSPKWKAFQQKMAPLPVKKKKRRKKPSDQPPKL